MRTCLRCWPLFQGCWVLLLSKPRVVFSILNVCPLSIYTFLVFGQLLLYAVPCMILLDPCWFCCRFGQILSCMCFGLLHKFYRYTCPHVFALFVCERERVKFVMKIKIAPMLLSPITLIVIPGTSLHIDRNTDRNTDTNTDKNIDTNKH